MQHPVMWFEVLGRDAATLCQFYGGLFGWRFNGDPTKYGMVDEVNRGIPGGVGESYPGTRPWVTFYVETTGNPEIHLVDHESRDSRWCRRELSGHAPVGDVLRRDARRDGVARSGGAPRGQGRHAADRAARGDARRARRPGRTRRRPRRGQGRLTDIGAKRGEGVPRSASGGQGPPD